MNEQDFDRTDKTVRKKNKVTKFREYFDDDDDNKKNQKKRKQNRKPKRKRPQDNDW